MLLEIIDGTEGGGLVVIKDSVNCPGRRLLKSCVNAALRRKESVHVLGFDVSEEELRAGLDGEAAKSLVFHNGYTDPLCWTGMGTGQLTALHFSAQEIRAQISQSRGPEPVTLAVDSLSWVLRHNPTASVCQSLQELRRDGLLKRILVLLHSDLHQHGMVDSVCHLASTVVTVVPFSGLGGVVGEAAPQGIAMTTQHIKSGKVLQEEECFTVGQDLSVQVYGRPSQPGLTEPEPEDSQADPASNLTFNLRLSEHERQAKDNLALPFAFSQEKKSALLRPRAGGGQILYEPDAADDFDQEDPDDDLDV
ncbi:elongator complex protein 5 [Lepisosteus oculatus]|uniref:elongator complex protein 5 n=1 Tax=Lepisosteus oculatus TaxID=7918 RepID=UPI0037248F70